MNQASFCNARRNLLIGLLAALVPLATLHAADGNQQWRQDQPDASPPAMPSEKPDRGSTSGQYERDGMPSTDPRGVQGPIRSDTTEQTPEYTREMQRRHELDTKLRQQDEERRRAEGGRLRPDNTLPNQFTP